MHEAEAPEMLDPRVRAYLDAELRQAESDFARVAMPAVQGPRHVSKAPVFGAAIVVLLIALVAGSSLLGRLGTGPVAGPSASLGASAAPVASGSSAPSPSSAASPLPSSSVAPSAAASTPAGRPVLDCGRIVDQVCAAAIALARAGQPAEVAGAPLVVVDDTCPPAAACDRKYGFDSIVVFVTAGADTTGWYPFYVTGVDPLVPTKAEPWVDDLPTHIANRVWQHTHPSGSGAPVATPSAGPSFVTNPPTGQLVWFQKATFSADRRTLTLDFTGGKPFDPSDPCSVAYEGWAEASGDTLYAAVVDVTRHVSGATPPPCDAMGYGRSVRIALSSPFTGARLVDLAGYVHFLRAPAGLVELHGLPEAWKLRSQSDVEESPAGRWLRVYSPSADPPEGTSKGRVELYQAFGGPVNVTGGEDIRTVTVNGQEATLYRHAPSGELVLVWTLNGSGLALVANEADFSEQALISLAESAAAP